MTFMTRTETDARRIAVIGAGAAGMMAAITAAEAGADVTLFERNDRVGQQRVPYQRAYQPKIFIRVSLALFYGRYHGIF